MDFFVESRVNLSLRRGMGFSVFSYDENTTFGNLLVECTEIRLNWWRIGSALVHADDVVRFIDSLFIDKDIVVKLDATSAKRCGVGSKYQ